MLCPLGKDAAAPVCHDAKSKIELANPMNRCPEKIMENERNEIIYIVQD